MTTIFLSKEILQGTFAFIGKLLPDLNLEYFLQKILSYINYEISCIEKKDFSYRLIYQLLANKIIIFADEKPYLAVWDKINLISPYNDLHKEPQKILNFTLRFVALCLSSLKNKLERDDMVKIAKTILTITKDKTFPWPQMDSPQCNLSFILHYYRKHKLNGKEISDRAEED